jgi:hypothetical protein
MKISHATLELLEPKLAAKGKALTDFRLLRISAEVWILEGQKHFRWACLGVLGP